jgi:hypothetical protein
MAYFGPARPATSGTSPRLSRHGPEQTPPPVPINSVLYRTDRGASLRFKCWRIAAVFTIRSSRDDAEVGVEGTRSIRTPMRRTNLDEPVSRFSPVPRFPARLARGLFVGREEAGGVGD